MNLDEVDNIVRTARRAMRLGRIGFSVQQVNCIHDHHEVIYYECLARLNLDGAVITAGEFLPALEASGYAPELDLHLELSLRMVVEECIRVARMQRFIVELLQHRKPCDAL
ncbi:EAL domain-containing protein [Ensifer aridi]|uniref:EAL domain-containing protein n=1 Tax=Ensifer aridi TaxID=1708715 RepID=UPI0015E3402A|nr:EAL domain-containing protein [Ensifer aridi]